MTERLYYKDSCLLQFESVITESVQTESGYAVVLERSAFYPTSGGQFHDTGRLNEIEVLDVTETEEGQVHHFTSAPVGQAGDKVVGRIDSQRRYDNCRKHTAQHILSHAFVELFEMETVSVHLGDQYASIELNNKSVTEEQLMQAEALANQLVSEAWPIRIRFENEEEAAKLPLRKMPARSGVIRIIQIGELEYSACGGTHCRNTSEVGTIKLVGTEKIRGNISVRFLSGRLARDDYFSRFEVTNRLATNLTCHYSDLEERFARTFEENKEIRKELNRLQAERMPRLAEELASKAGTAGRTSLLVESVDLANPKLLGQLAALAAENTGGIVILISDKRAALATAPGSGHHAGKLAGEFVKEFSLKGGGGEYQAQLVGVDLQELAAYRKIVEKQLDQS
ncbi:MAG: alanine--tRNA ligase-related protein [bacterium]|nr:alanine--tRNA ligase-related protein [bacterium]